MFSTIFGNSNTLVLSTYSSIDSQFLDENDIETINALFVDALKQYIDTIDTSDDICSDDDCALDALSKSSNDEVIYSRLQKLGSKIIFLASILDQEKSFNSKVTALSIEDMDQVALRLAKSIALRQTLDESADIENITEQDEKDVARRKSLGRTGISFGYFFPFEGIEHTYENHWPDQGTTTDINHKFFKINLNYYHEFKNNSALMYEFGGASPGFMFLDLNFMKFKNKVDTSPFYGGGVGLFNIVKDITYDNRNDDGGIGLNLQAGVLLYRTYDFNVLIRAKFIQLLNDDFDRGIMFDVGVQWKRSERSTNTRTIYRFPLLEALFD
tara:strand:- start:3005 stop:3985 length:981 start_codon:yes stop_codon:yes gene_type:complete